MHARNRTWPLGSDPAERCRQRTMPVEGGDGSTLSLDFTTGVLDPRLTFTRGSNATFINSSGLVQWADANEFRNTGWVTSTTPTGWNVTFGTGTTTWNNDGTLTMNTGGSSTRPCINANSFTVSQGIAYTFGYTVVSASGSPQIFNVISSMVAGETFAINGATVGPTTVVQAGDVVSCTFTPTGTTAIPRMGPGVNTGMTNTAMTITRPQMNPGVSLQSYLANSSTTAANNNTSRFDYDPTSIGTPRGLLIEGATDNRVTQSESFSSWTLASTALGATASGPDGNTSSALTLREDNANSMHACVLTSRTVTSGSPATFSVFVKAGASPRRYILIRVNDNASNANAASVMWDTQARTISGAATAYGTFTNVSATRTEYAATSWDRIALTFTPSTATIACKLELSDNGSRSADGQSVAYLGNNSSGVLIWGAQLELGSGASSYIPTGASQGSRAADNCEITGTNFSSWWPNPTAEFTVLWTGDMTRIPPASAQFIWLSRASGTSKARAYVTTGSVIRANSSVVDFTASPATTATANTVFKSAMAVKSGDSAMYVNSGSVIGSQTDASTGTTTNHDSLYFNPNVDNFMHIRVFKFWPTRLSNATMQGLVS
jgi:hypothetical protein